MILVDTSVWVEHLRQGNLELRRALHDALVLIHPFVAGELACGNMKNRAGILGDLATLPPAIPATHAEVMRLIEDRKLWGLGIGWIDAHLLASALLSGSEFWTRDAKLARAAPAAGVKLHPRAGINRTGPGPA